MIERFDSVPDEIGPFEEVVVNDDYDLEHRSKMELTERKSNNRTHVKNKENSSYSENFEDGLA